MLKIIKSKISLLLLLILPILVLATEFDKESIIIKKLNGGEVKFSVKIADDNKERGRGLMHVDHLAEEEGMLFMFDQEGIVEMWMKNTIIPLDMLFIDRSGKITNIHKNAKVESLDTISSEGRVIAVLEINAMLTDKFGIKEGDKIIHSLFDNEKSN